jgi:predicted phage terminase large subunit-like protein
MTPPNTIEAAKRLLRIKKAGQSFSGFIEMRHPEWTHRPPFHDELIQVIDDLLNDRLFNDRGERVDNLMVTMPPRHSKSTFTTIEAPAYAMANDPFTYIMTTSYNAELATDFGREVRNAVNSPDYKLAFPDTSLAKDSQASNVWRTSAGGAYYGMGLGGSTSGRPANILIVDDPYKNREDAESPSTRRKVWSYYQSALVNRLQPTHDGRPPKQIVIHTRWHPDDLIGTLMRGEDFKEGRWYHVDFKGITTDSSGQEQALWPERFPLDFLHRLKRLNPREFEALYQQSPFIEGGNIIKEQWWQYYPTELVPDRFATIIIPVDTAFKKGAGNDYTVAMPMGLTPEGDIFVLGVIRDRYNFPELKQRLIQLNNEYRGKGLRATYIEDLASGQSLIQELKSTSGIAVIPYRAGKDKESRVHAITPIIQGGRVFLPEKAPWLDDFLRECEQFPFGSFDDQIDCMTMGVDILSRTAISPEDQWGSDSSNASLLQEYNEQRDLILGHGHHPATKSSLNAKRKSQFKWRGWGV